MRKTSVRIDRIKFSVALSRADMTIGQLCELTGLGRSTVSTIKSGRSCSAETADKLASVLGADILEVTE